MSRSRYLAIAGPEDAIAALLGEERLARRLRLRLPVGLRLPGLALFTDHATEIVPAGGHGWIVGRLHRRSDDARIVRLDAADAQAAAGTGGGSLIERFWGSYAAFLRLGDGSIALREPSGAVPVYAARRGGLDLYFSSAGDAVETGLVPPSLDPVFPLHWLAYPYLRTGRTGLAAVREVLPGCRRRSSAAVAADEQAWSPWVHASPARQLRDFKLAAALLRETLLRTVPALATSRNGILIELSGGLDSAIVAAALKKGGIAFDAANFVTSSPDGDERRYARAAAEWFEAPLAEIHEEDGPLDLGAGQRTLLPGLSPLVAPLHRAFARHGAESGAASFFTGAGGDNIFCYLTTTAPILDAARDLGWRAAAGRTAWDTAELNACTWWTAIRVAAAKAARRRADPWKADSGFLDRRSIPPLELHPWLHSPRDARIGRVEHIASLLRIQHFLDPETRASDIESVHPLMAQPLVELCLTIPSWLWSRGGRDRAVARAAMGDLLPPAIASRRTKGRLEGMCARAFMRSRRAVAELLLGGCLAGRGALDRPALEAYLRREGEPADILYFRVLELAATELWLRSWRG